jgi:hypothetical protein
MTGFIGTSLQLQSVMTAHNQWLSTTRSIPFWTTSVFSSTVTNGEWRIPAHTLNCLEGRLPQDWINDASESESYVTTDGQSASLSWNKTPIWGLRPDFYYCQTGACLLMWGALSDERTGLSFTIAADPHQSSHSWVRVPWDSPPYFTVSDSKLHSCRLLRLAGLRWRYSNPPPHGILPYLLTYWINDESPRLLI